MLAFLAFLVGYALSQFFRSFLAVIAPELAHELTLSAADLGNISAAWFAGFALAQFAVGIALDRIGPRRTVPALMLAGVLGAALFSRAHSGHDAILAMALIGVGCSPALMGPLFVFARTYPARRFALLSSTMIGLGSIGNLMGGTPLALADQAFGWRGVFLGLAGVTLAAAVLIAILVRDPPQIDAENGGHTGWIGGLRDVMSIRPLWPIWPLMGLGYGVLIAERGLWVGPYLSDIYQLAPVPRGNIIFLMALAITAGALAYGPLDQWLGTRKWVVFTGSAVTGLALLGLWYFPHPELSVAAALLCVVGFAGMIYGVIMAHIRSFVPEHIVGRGITFANFLCMGGAGVIQVVSGHYAESLKVAQLPPESLYAELHLGLALTLLSATAIYAFSRDRA